MATIPLRTYIREIASKIDSGNIEEAIAHCRHILKTYPKHIDTYRLLGKAYLESHHFGDAADVFQRVLASIPDDFVAHLGMSIIRQEESNLDAAIWHMERAFEVQPSNTAIQEELRRLYGRRDGVQPMKIHLTRGALARMYIKGNLYPQAIAELRTALAEEPDRPDMLALLARVYFLTSKRVEAIDTSSTLVNKYPYCLEANRILAEILAGTERAAESQVFRQRLQALDPYVVHVSVSMPSPEMIPAHLVSLEMYEWKTTEPYIGAPSQPEWAASLGIKFEEPKTTGKESLEWLTRPKEKIKEVEKEKPSLPREEVVPSEISEKLIEPTEITPKEPAFPSEEMEKTVVEPAVPDWLTSLEDVSSVKDHVSASYPFDIESDDLITTQGELTPGEIPDWLRDLAPREVPGEETISEDLVGEGEVQLSKQIAPSFETGIPTPALAAEKYADEISLPIEEMPEVSPEIPEWLEDLTTEPTIGKEGITRPEPETESVEALPGEIPDWLKSMAEPDLEGLAEVTPGPETPEWMGVIAKLEEKEAQILTKPSDLDQFKVETPTILSSEELEEEGLDIAIEKAEIPDWLRELSPEETIPTTETELQLHFDKMPTEAISLEPQKEEVVPIAETTGVTDEFAMPPELEKPIEKVLVTPSEPELIPSFAIEQQVLSEEELVLESQPAPSVEETIAQAFEIPAWLAGLGQEETPPEEMVIEPTAQPEMVAIMDFEPILGDTQPIIVTPIIELPAEQVKVVPPSEALPEEVLLPVEEEVEIQPVTAVEKSKEMTALGWLEFLATRKGVPDEQLFVNPEERLSTPPEWVQELVDKSREVAITLPEAESQPSFLEPEKPTWIPEFPEEVVPEQAEVMETAVVEMESVPAAWVIEEKALEREEGVEGRVDINTATLAELERLPEIGFILAQQIVDYRSEHGSITSLDDLQRAIGFDNPTRETLGKSLFIPVIEKIVPPKLDDTQKTIEKARRALKKGKVVEALETYNILINDDKLLESVIQDIHEAVIKFPSEVYLFQTLGDAYSHNNQLNEAIDAYQKAEELIN